MKSFPLHITKISAHKWLQLAGVLVLITLLLFWFVPDRSIAFSIGAAVFVALTLVAIFADRRKHVRVELTSDFLQVRGDIYGKKWPLANFALAKARRVDLHTERTLRPRLKIFGTSMGGYHAGEFRLRNKMTATIFLSDESSVVVLPFRSGSLLMLSLGDDFLQALQATIRSE